MDTQGVPREKYDNLRSEAEACGNATGEGRSKSKGNSNGKPAGLRKPTKKEEFPVKPPHNLKKQSFNVFFFKFFGSKSLSLHLVKVGPDTCDLTELLEQWQVERNIERYKKLGRFG